MTPEERRREERKLIAKHPQLDNLITFLLQGGDVQHCNDRRPLSGRPAMMLKDPQRRLR